jgi:hypothetical protein
MSISATKPTGNGTLPPAALQAAELLAEHWPAGARHRAAGAVAGGLLRAGWAVPDVEHFLDAVTEKAGDEEPEKRLELVSDTADKLREGKAVSGWPTLAQVLGKGGDGIVRQLLAGLGISRKITLAELAAHKGLPVEYLQGLGLHDLPDGGVGSPTGTATSPAR